MPCTLANVSLSKAAKNQEHIKQPLSTNTRKESSSDMPKTMPHCKRRLRKQFAVLIGLLSLALAITLAACTQPTSPAASSSPAQSPAAADGSIPAAAMPIEFRIGYQVVPNAELLTKSLGLVEQRFPNIKITWLLFDSSRDVNIAMVSGGLDAGLIESVLVSTGIAQNLPYQVYFVHDVMGDNEALAVTEASNITSMADLAGKKIGVPFGSTTHFSLLSALKQAGIESKDVEIFDMQPQDMLAAWEKGDINGGFVWQPTLAKLIEAKGTVLVTAKQLAETGIVTADLGVVSKDFAAAYPDFLNGYVGALNEATQRYRDDPEAAANAISAEIGRSPEESLSVMNELVWLDVSEQASAKYLGTPEAPGELSQVLKDSAEFMVVQDAIVSAPDINAYKAALYNQAVATEAAS